MKNDNNTVDLDDFWDELISKSEWSKSATLKTPGEFKNLNILESRKKNISPIPPEKKIGQPQNVNVKKSPRVILLLIVKSILVVVLIALVVAIVIIFSFILFRGHWNFGLFKMF
jgi:hypothetical protein